MVRTDHILFIAAGAFHVSKPSDLIPELQGRFPIRVELESLTVDDFKRILIEPKNSLVRQYRALMETEGVKLEFALDAIDAIANFAAKVNQQTEDVNREAAQKNSPDRRCFAGLFDEAAQRKYQRHTDNENEQRKDQVIERNTSPWLVVHLMIQNARWSDRPRLVKRMDNFLSADNPEHIESAKRIE